MCDYSHNFYGFFFFKKKCDYSHKSLGVFKKAGNSSADSKIIIDYGKSHVKVKISCDYSHNLIAILKKVGKNFPKVAIFKLL